MTNETLNQILNNINNEIYKEIDYAIRSISSDVDLININAINCIELNFNNFYDFYLLKGNNTKDKYIGIILDMENDLHILINKEYRGHKYLQKTLIPTILPFIAYYKERSIQYLTFESSKVEEYFIKEFGFKKTDTLRKLYISLEDMIEVYKSEFESTINMSEDIEEKLISELDNAILTLRMIERKLELQKNNTFFSENNYLSDVYCDLKDRIRF